MSARRRAGSVLATAATVAVVATVVAAILAMGSPATQRKARLDERRIEDLQQIEAAVRVHREQSGALPRDLATLASEPGRRLAVVDPESRQPYGYALRGANGFRLCASFETDTATTPPGRLRHIAPEWHHGAGQHCFDRAVPVPAAATVR